MEKIVIHTSDRSTFKRCRRKWYFSSPLQRNLTPVDADKSIHLWFGSGFHFALEDYHGHNKFGNPAKALEAYYNAFPEASLPIGADEMVAMGMGMLDYYLDWMKAPGRLQTKTLWLDGEPMVEKSFELEIADLSDYARKNMIAQQITYHGTIDRIVVDQEGRWWLEDYKTAAAIDTKKLLTDSQISTYLWAAEQYLDHEIAGMIFTQFLKDVPKGPRAIAAGFSKDKRQKTPHAYYRQALIQEYGAVPAEYLDILDELASRETAEGNKFIRMDRVERNDTAKESTYEHIINEGLDMLDQLDQTRNPRVYPNFTRDCAWDCSFRQYCLAMDEGHDFEDMLEDNFELRNESAKGEKEPWREKIVWPKV